MILIIIKLKVMRKPPSYKLFKKIKEIILKLMILAFLTTIFLRNLNISVWCCWLHYDTHEDHKVETSLLI